MEEVGRLLVCEKPVFLPSNVVPHRSKLFRTYKCPTGLGKHRGLLLWLSLIMNPRTACQHLLHFVLHFLRLQLCFAMLRCCVVVCLRQPEQMRHGNRSGRRTLQHTTTASKKRTLQHCNDEPNRTNCNCNTKHRTTNNCHQRRRYHFSSTSVQQHVHNMYTFPYTN